MLKNNKKLIYSGINPILQGISSNQALAFIKKQNRGVYRGMKTTTDKSSVNDFYVFSSGTYVYVSKEDSLYYLDNLQIAI